MSDIDTAIQSIQDGMNKINQGIQLLNQTSYKNVVKDEELEIDERNANRMSVKEMTDYYEGKLNKCDEKVRKAG